MPCTAIKKPIDLVGLIRLYPDFSDLIRVPLPLTLFFLFGSGLSGLGGLRQKIYQPSFILSNAKDLLFKHMIATPGVDVVFALNSLLIFYFFTA